MPKTKPKRKRRYRSAEDKRRDARMRDYWEGHRERLAEELGALVAKRYPQRSPVVARA